MGDTTHAYSPRDYRRVCDQCGLLFNRSRLHRKGPWIFCDICDAPGDRIREEEDAAIARQRPFRILPVPNAKPLTVDSPYTWEAEEAQVFDLIALTAPSRFIGGAPDVLSAGAAAAYMADIIIEGARPVVWLSTARTVLDRCLKYLLSVQYGSATGVVSTLPNPRYGGFLEGSSFLSSRVIQAGIGFIRGYTATGTIEYLNGAKRCATFIRHAQCADLQNPYSTYPSAGTRYHVGGVATSLSNSTGLLSSQYLLSDVSAAKFIAYLGDAIGMDTTFGDSASTAFYSAATATTLTTMGDELVAFAETGAKSLSHSGDYVSGLSTTHAYDAYDAGRSDGSGGIADWTNVTTVSVASTTGALAGIFALNGVTDKVTEMLAWLDAFTPNPVNATPSTNTEQQTLNGITGTYDPTLCPAVILQATAPFTEAAYTVTGGSLYSLNRLGELAPILAETSPARLRNSRATLSPGQRFSTFDLSLRYLGPLGRAGLSLQPRSTATSVTPDVSLAAGFGNVYRFVNP